MELPSQDLDSIVCAERERERETVCEWVESDDLVRSFVRSFVDAASVPPIRVNSYKGPFWGRDGVGAAETGGLSW